MSLQPLDRIGTVQRFVEHEHVRIAHERGRDLRPLPHALAERVDAPVGDVEHRDGLERVVGRVPVDDAMEVGDVAHELPRGEPARHRFVLGYQREPAEHLAIAAGIAVLDAHPTLVDVDEARDRAHERGLPGAVGPEQARHARAERTAELRQRNLLPEPHRYVAHRHGRVRGERGIVHDRPLRAGRRGHRSTQRYRRSNTATPVSTTTTYAMIAKTPPLVTPESGDR